MRLKTKQKRALILMAVIIGLFSFVTWQNNGISINEMSFKHQRIPEAFDGYRILHLSDLHNKEFGPNQTKLLEKIKRINPDIIVITGDLIDSKKINVDVAMDLINGAKDIAPIYYVSGNHEAWSGLYGDLKSRLEASGVVVLDDQSIQVFKDKDSIEIIGLSDLSFSDSDKEEYGSHGKIENLLGTLAKEENNFKILLSHRPELFETYSDSHMDLVFSGHAHGGQFRLPFVGGLIAPNQGFFPKLTDGIHTLRDTSMVISRGLGNSVIPLRIFNRPELMVVTLSNP